MRPTILFLFLLIMAPVAMAQSYLGATTSAVNLREGPGTNYAVLRMLQPGTQLFIESRTGQGDFLNVLDIMTNTEGWVHRSFVQFGEVVKPNEDGVFTPTGRTGSSLCELEIENDTELVLTLKMNDRTYVFGKGERREISVSPGTYSYRASAPGVLPDIGTEHLDRGTRYSWTFYIVTQGVPDYRQNTYPWQR